MDLTWFKVNKIPLISIGAFLFCIMAGCLMYNLFGHQIIKVIYEGKLAGILNSNEIMDGQNKHPLEHYLDKGDWIFSEIIRLVFALFLSSIAFFLYLKFAKGKYHKPKPIEWFYLIAGLFLIQRYYWIMDDAYIFFRYIDNMLFLNIGLVYNKGEYVEGYSSPLWTLLLALFRATGVSYWVIFRVLSVICFLLFWFMLVQLNRKLSSGITVMNFPLAYLALNYGVLTYFSSGMETTLVQVFAVAYALYILNPSSRALQVVLALSPLLRHELIIPFTLCVLWAWFYNKKFPFKMVSMVIGFVGSWVIFRIYYYADLFPNTFYLKNISDIQQGLIYVHDTLKTYHFYILAVLFVILIILLKKKHINLELSKRFMMVLTAAPIALYVIKIGGDWAHYHYLAFPFILIVCALAGIMENFIETFKLNKYRILSPATGILISLVMFLSYPPQLERHPVFINSKNAKATLVDKIYDAAQGSKRQELYPSYLDWGTMINIHMMKEYKKKHKEFKYEDVDEAAGCKFAYIGFNKRIIHRLGLTDAILARTDMKSDLAAHKYGLKPLGDDLIVLYATSDYIGRGMFRKAVEEGGAPEWVKKNLETIEIIESKIYNTHNFRENMKLALTFPPKIKP